ncbi:hypothetical protein KKG83_02435 [Candidatus Micrarchaeota archaeon]|nr:hypothetical protein [Candidatus Micrarchaeota archaeon]MBU2476308.1 hypothetical protein [Candidatus Micrarchaeota archaeon]
MPAIRKRRQTERIGYFRQTGTYLPQKPKQIRRKRIQIYYGRIGLIKTKKVLRKLKKLIETRIRQKKETRTKIKSLKAEIVEANKTYANTLMKTGKKIANKESDAEDYERFMEIQVRKIEKSKTKKERVNEEHPKKIGKLESRIRTAQSKKRMDNVVLNFNGKLLAFEADMQTLSEVNARLLQLEKIRLDESIAVNEILKRNPRRKIKDIVKEMGKRGFEINERKARKIVNYLIDKGAVIERGKSSVPSKEKTEYPSTRKLVEEELKKN